MKDSGDTDRAPQAAVTLDALQPSTIARKAEEIGVAKAGMNALSLLVLAILASQHELAGGGVGQTMLAIGNAKAELPFAQAFFLGILCNVLVCLAVRLCYGAHMTTDKLLAILFPIAAFVAAGFEHSGANMYFIPLAMIVKAFAADGFWSLIGAAPDAYDAVSLAGLPHNLVPVTLGNIIGAGVLVGLVYWFVYLRRAGQG